MTTNKNVVSNGDGNIYIYEVNYNNYVTPPNCL